MGRGAYVEVVERSLWVEGGSTVWVVAAAVAAAAVVVVVDTTFLQHDLVYFEFLGLRQWDMMEADNPQRTAPCLEGLEETRHIAADHKCNRLTTASSYGYTYPLVVLRRDYPDIVVFVVISGTQQQRERDPFGILDCCVREQALIEEVLAPCDGGVAGAVAEVGLPWAHLADDSRDSVPASFVA